MENFHIPIEYTIPSLGIINTKIYKPYAASCYIFLEKYGFIDKLKRISQLGVIKNTFNGSHHPRWEYVVLQIYLLNSLKNTNYKSGLGSNYKIVFKDEEIKLSGCELIQIWILLLNSGHIPGTFASERGFLLYLNQNYISYKTFKRGLPKNLKEIFDEKMYKNDIYDIHKFIMAFLLKRHTHYPVKCGKNKSIKFVNFLIKCLELFMLNNENDEKLLKYKFYFNRIRQLSYLFLDSHYTAFPINFNISQFIFNLDYHVQELFSPNSHLNETLHSFDNLLTNDLYNSKQSIYELTIHSDYILTFLSSNKLDTLMDIKNLLENNYSKFNPLINELDNDYEILYLPINLGDFLPMNNSIADKYFTNNLENDLNNLIGKKNLLTIQKSSNRRLMTITIVFRNGNYYNHILSIVRLTKKLIDLKHEIIEDNGDYIKIFVDTMFNESFKRIILFILNKSHYTHNILFKYDEMNQRPNILSVKTKKDFDIDTLKFLKGSEKYEYELTEQIAKKFINRNKSLVSFSSLIFYDINYPKQDLHEIDGAILNFKRNNLQIILIEAKNQKNNSIQDAKSQLYKAISTIKFYSKNTLVIKEFQNPKGAYSIININNC